MARVVLYGDGGSGEFVWPQREPNHVGARYMIPITTKPQPYKVVKDPKLQVIIDLLTEAQQHDDDVKIELCMAAWRLLDKYRLPQKAEDSK